MSNNVKNILIVIAVWLITACIVSIAVNNTYGYKKLGAFNKLNGTSYTIKQWRVYEYDIKKLHPFVGQGANQ